MDTFLLLLCGGIFVEVIAIIIIVMKSIKDQSQ